MILNNFSKSIQQFFLLIIFSDQFVYILLQIIWYQYGFCIFFFLLFCTLELIKHWNEKIVLFSISAKESSVSTNHGCCLVNLQIYATAFIYLLFSLKRKFIKNIPRESWQLILRRLKEHNQKTYYRQKKYDFKEFFSREWERVQVSSIEQIQFRKVSITTWLL